MSILIASTDHEQLAQLCDRVIVFRRGRPALTLEGAAVTKDAIARASLQAPDQPAPSPRTELHA